LIVGEVGFKLEAESGDAVKAFHRITTALERNEKQFKKNAKAGQQGFGPQAVTSLMKYAGGFASIAGAVRLATSALTDYNRVRDEGAQRVTDAISGRRYLMQIAKDEAHYQELAATAERIRTQYGLQEGAAYRLVGQAGSAGQQFVTAPGIDTLAKLPQIAFDPASAIESALKIQGAFGGAGAGVTGGGDLKQILNKLIEAARLSSVGAEQIAGAMSTATIPWASIGGQDEGLMAFTAIATDVFKSPLAASEKIQSLATQIMKKRHLIETPEGMEGLGGLGLIEKLPEWAEQGRLKSEGGKVLSLVQFLGESNAIQAIDLYRKMQPEILTRMSDVMRAEDLTGTEQDALKLRLGISQRDPQSASVNYLNRMREDREKAEEDRYAVTRTLAQGLEEEIVASKTRQGHHFLRTWAMRRAFDVSQLVLGDETFLRGWGRYANPESQEKITGHLDKLDNVVDRVDKLADIQNRQLDAQNKTNALLEDQNRDRRHRRVNPSPVE